MSSNKNKQFCQRYNELFVPILLLVMMSSTLLFAGIRYLYGLSVIRDFILNIELIGTGLDALLFISYKFLKKIKCSSVYTTSIGLTTAGFGFLFTVPLIAFQVMPLIMSHIAQALLGQ